MNRVVIVVLGGELLAHDGGEDEGVGASQRQLLQRVGDPDDGLGGRGRPCCAAGGAPYHQEK